MTKKDVGESLSELQPKTEFGAFKEIWPQIEDALNRGIRRNAIWTKLKDEQVLNVSYVTFTRFVKEMKEAAPVRKTIGPAALSQVRDEIPVQEASDDKSGFVSDSADALARAKEVAKIDYKKLAKEGVAKEREKK
jgi:hypothetical protein